MTDPAGHPLLQLEGVTKSFGAVRALRGVSFDLRAGEVHALLGENGAGKSTLIKVMTGAHSPDAGRMSLRGEPVAGLTPSRAHALGIACIYQQPALFRDLTIAENLSLRLDPPRATRRVDWAGQRARALGLLARVGARLDPDAEVESLSMPEQQLVEIACAVGAGARILIMDEPTASLTRQEQELLFELVRGLRSEGVGVVYISHRLEEIFALADRVTVLRDGESAGTFQVEGMTEEGLIERMVGREVSHLFPPRRARPAGEVLLSVERLSCEASGLREISFEVGRGEILGFAGLVGAGRTELARTLFGITPPDSGRVTLGGRELRLGSPREAVAQGIGYLPEDRRRHGLILDMALSANMTLAIHPRMFPGAWLRLGAERDFAVRLIQELSIKAYGPEVTGGALSGGNQQKVALARWLAASPQLLILDEPTQGVDVGAKGEIHRLVRELADGGIGVMMISSDLPEILGMSDRIAVMRGGRLTTVLRGAASAQEVMAAALGQGGEVPRG
ncbi:MAG TPA: D-xylose ABC transporter ATP-binding protein [Verrucomicrobiales bacterium]|nr:D-xylose ABC transporter ATP-binding protein [Verrucomicrobiales bacterium]